MTEPTVELSSFINTKAFPLAPGTSKLLRLLNGIAEGKDLANRTALESNLELLGNSKTKNNIAFDKGCYLGQELTARSFFKGVIRKRVLPAIVVTASDEIVNADGTHTIPDMWRGEKLEPLTEDSEPTEQDMMDPIFGLMKAAAGDSLRMNLPRLSATAAGAYMWLSMGGNVDKSESVGLLDDINRGDKITKDGKNIGSIISQPLEGQSIVLVELRLDKVTGKGGMIMQPFDAPTDGEVMIGDKTVRILPFVPQWWPEIDGVTGKELVKKTTRDDPTNLTGESEFKDEEELGDNEEWEEYEEDGDEEEVESEDKSLERK